MSHTGCRAHCPAAVVCCQGWANGSTWHPWRLLTGFFPWSCARALGGHMRSEPRRWQGSPTTDSYPRSKGSLGTGCLGTSAVPGAHWRCQRTGYSTRWKDNTEGFQICGFHPKPNWELIPGSYSLKAKPGKVSLDILMWPHPTWLPMPSSQRQ